MSNQTKFLPPELLSRVLEHCDLVEQLIWRRVNQEFKQVVENVNWPSVRKLGPSAAHYFCSSKKMQPRYSGTPFKCGHTNDQHVDHIDKFLHIVLPHMPNLRIISTSSNNLNLIAQHCHRVENFGYSSARETLRYAVLLLELGVDISSNQFKFDLVQSLSDKEYDMMSRLPKDSIFLYGEYIFQKMRFPDNIYSGTVVSSVEEIPYMKNLKDITVPKLTPTFISNYQSQITNLYLNDLKHTNKLHHFSNLVKLDFETMDIILTPNDERDKLLHLENYLASDSGKNLTSLYVCFHNFENINRFIKKLSTLDRPSKWKFLYLRMIEIPRDGIACGKEYLHFKNRYLKFCWPSEWPLDNSLEFTKILISKLRTVVNLKISKHEKISRLPYFKLPSISQVQFDNWKEWFVSYASQHRNKQVKLTLWQESRPSLNIMNKRDNWCIIRHMELVKKDISVPVITL